MREGESHTSICCAANRLISMMRFVEKQAFWQEARRLSCINGKGLIRKRTVVFAISTLLALSLSGCAASELNSDNSAEPQVNTSQSTPQSSQQNLSCRKQPANHIKSFGLMTLLGRLAERIPKRSWVSFRLSRSTPESIAWFCR